MDFYEAGEICQPIALTEAMVGDAGLDIILRFIA